MSDRRSYVHNVSSQVSPSLWYTDKLNIIQRRRSSFLSRLIIFLLVPRSLCRGKNERRCLPWFIVWLGTRRSAWRCSQGCYCVARELKWKINLCPWILPSMEELSVECTSMSLRLRSRLYVGGCGKITWCVCWSVNKMRKFWSRYRLMWVLNGWYVMTKRILSRVYLKGS